MSASRAFSGVAAVLLWALLLGCGPAAAADVPAVLPDGPVRLATLEWEPYVGRDLPEQGFTTEIVRAVFGRAGLATRIRFMPWPRVLRGVESGRSDVAYPAYRSAERERRFAVSSSFARGPIGFFAPVGSGVDLASAHALAGRRIGVVRGYVNTEALDASEDLVKEVSASDQLNLRKLAKGRIDLAIADRLTGEHLIARDPTIEPGSLVFLEPPLEEKSLHVLFRGDTERGRALAAAFERGLAEIRADGTLAAILERHGL